MTVVDTSGLDRVAYEFDHGAGAFPDRVREFSMAFPVELAKVRRQAFHVHGRRAGLHPVAVKGSVARGLAMGHFSTPLRDGTFGYLQRRTDDCLQAAIASCVQIGPHQIPDLHLLQQLYSKGFEETWAAANKKMGRWADKHGVTVVRHAKPKPSARRWIGVIAGEDGSAAHCLLMNKRDCLFDPACLYLPPSPEHSMYDPVDIDYAITIERN